MSNTKLFDEYTDAVRERAMTMNGQAVVVNLVGGQTLTGTLAYASTTGPQGWTVWPNVLTVTVTGKAHSARLDHISSIGQG
ncbi:hypothetical protein ACWC4J_11280 [Streptomyces sp. NPDC001356]